MSLSSFTDLPRNTILVGDARARLAELPEASVDCVITSPPYFGLRDYGMPDQIGNEQHIDEWVRQLLDVCRGLNRVLKPTGALWLNLGDGYSRHNREGAAKKSLLLGPQRVALALAADGWLLRNQVIWAKTNPMPSSVTDRLSCTHEILYFFTRRTRYYFDLDAIRAESKTQEAARPRVGGELYPPIDAAAKNGDTVRTDLNHGLSAMKHAGRWAHPLGKNPGDVWHVPTASYHGAHFATFPIELVQRPLLATCPAKTCSACGTPWRRRTQRIEGRLLATGTLKANCNCEAPPVAGLVLDPFMGAGTVAIAADQHRRDWLGIELNPQYAALAQHRLANWRAKHRAVERPP